MVWDGSFIPHWDVTCINMMLSHESEPEIVYGETFSIEALHVFLGYQNIDMRQNPLSLEKYFESSCSYERTQLGLTIALTKKKRLSMIDELSHWHKK